MGSRRALPRSRPLRRRLLRLYDRLHRRFGAQGWWPARSALEVIVGAILTQSTVRVNAERVRARRLGAFVRHLERRHGGRLRRLLARPVDELRRELLDIPGIGPGTADSILLYAARRPVFVVDASTRRILARHRLVAPDVGYADLQRVFMDHLPRDPGLFNEYHALLVRVAKEHCRARPRCEGCPLAFDLRGHPPRL